MVPGMLRLRGIKEMFPLPGVHLKRGIDGQLCGEEDVLFPTPCPHAAIDSLPGPVSIWVLTTDQRFGKFQHMLMNQT
jgi:hypothetical protein